MDHVATGIGELIPSKAYHLFNSHCSLVVSQWKSRFPILAYVGSPLKPEEALVMAQDTVQWPWPAANSVVGDNMDKSWSPARLPNLWPSPDMGDFRSPALLAQVHGPQGSRPLMDWTMTSSRIYQGRPKLQGLVESRVSKDAQTLELTLVDPIHPDIAMVLSYTVLDEVILISSRLDNQGIHPVVIHKLSSASIDLFPSWQAQVISLHGAWARERSIQREALGRGRRVFESRRGISSHTSWPGIILCGDKTTLDAGPSMGFSLVWSGDWFLQAELDEDQGVRIQGGIHDDFLNHTLEAGDSIASPELVFSYSDDGLNGLSQVHHDFVHHHLTPPQWQGKTRPILINNWEATYFDFTRPVLEDIADKARGLGIELFVLDDGWFGQRSNDATSLGDWVANEEKLGGSLRDLALAMKSRGLMFGLWIEPEMVSPQSQLYREHPDWCLHQKDRTRSESRNQLVLDLAQAQVVDHLIGTFCKLLASAPIDYIKWDMNRPISHGGNQRLSWVKGLYRLMAGITEAFPHILFEGCAGGGGRMDYGSLYFMPQFWTSDNTDGVSRLAIQEGTSLFIPPSVMTAHVSAVPNHQTGRISGLVNRTMVAMEGNLGYELNLQLLSELEQEAIASHIAWYKEWRSVLLQGRRYRLAQSEHRGLRPRGLGWISVAPDKRRAVLAWAQESFTPNLRPPMVSARGLDPNLWYTVTPLFVGGKQGPGSEYLVYPRRLSGKLLATKGLPALGSPGDPSTAMWTLEASQE